MIDKILSYFALILFVLIIIFILYAIWFDLIIGLKATSSALLLLISQFIFNKIKKLG